MCNCIEEVNKELEKMQPNNNTKLAIPMSLGLSGILRVDRVQIKTEKRVSHAQRKPIGITAAYCPFCGKAYDEHEQIVTNL